MNPDNTNLGHPSDVFNFLSTTCITVSREPSVKTLADLKSKLQCLGKDGKLSDQALFRYVTFPLEITLGKAALLSEAVLIEVFACYREAMSYWIINEDNVLQRILYWCCRFLGSRRAVSGVDSISDVCEEMKLEIVLCLESAFSSASNLMLFCGKNQSLLGHCISLLLSIGEYERNRKLRVSSLRSLSVLAKVTVKEDTSLGDVVGNTVAFYIPGIAISICKVLTSDTSQGQEVRVEAIRLLRHLIHLTLNDEDIEKLPDLPQAVDSRDTSQKYMESQPFSVIRTKSWSEKTSINLNTILQRIFPVVIGIDHVRLQEECVCLAKTILSDCFTAMETCVPSCVDFLIHVIGTNNDGEGECLRVLEKTGAKMHVVGAVSLDDIITEKLMQALTQMPRIMRGSIESHKQSGLQQLLGYFITMRSSLELILGSQCRLDKLLIGFSQIFECSLDNQRLIEWRDFSSSSCWTSLYCSEGGQVVHTEFKKWKIFRWISDDRTLTLLSKLCHLLVQEINPLLLFDCTRNLFVSSVIHRNQAGMLLTEFLIGLRCKRCFDDSILNSVVSQVIDLYLSDEYWHLPTYNVGDKERFVALDIKGEVNSNIFLENDTKSFRHGMSSAHLSRNIQLTCIMLEGIQACCSLLGENFRVHLIRVLYPLLEKAGDDNILISEVAMTTMLSLCKDLKYKNTAELVLSNADYLVDASVFYLRHLDLFSTAPGVLIVMINCMDTELLPKLQDVLFEVYNALGRYKEDIVYVLMGVLRQWNIALCRWCTEATVKEESRKHVLTLDPCHDECTDLKVYLEEQCHLRRSAMGYKSAAGCGVDDRSALNSSDCEDKGESNSNDDEKELPWNINIAVMNVEKSLHFLNSRDLAVKQRALEVVKYGILAVRESQKALLPLVHQIWPCLRQETRSEHKTIRLKALEVLHVAVLYSKDFTKQRLCRDFLPYCRAFLQEQSMQRWEGEQTCRFSLDCKLLVKILTFLASTVPYLGLSDHDLDQLFSCCLPYVSKSKRHPKILQEAAMDLIRILEKLNYGLSWYAHACLAHESGEFKNRGYLRPVSLNTSNASDYTDTLWLAPD